MLTLREIDKSDFHKEWTLVHEGLLAVCDHCDRQDYPYPKPVMDIFRGVSTLFIGYRDGKYAGFLVLTPSYFEFGPRFLVVSAMHSIMQDREEWDEGYAVIRNFAQKMGAEFLEFRTQRRGFDRVLPSVDSGWKPAYTIWRREV